VTDTNVFQFSQPGTFADPLTEVLRNRLKEVWSEEHTRWSKRDYVLRPTPSVFNDEKKLSIAALSQTLPERLIEQTMP
jgi:hypothetical protein